MFRTLLLVANLLLLALLTWAWFDGPDPDPTPAAYRAALERHPGSTVAVDRGLAAFRSTFADLAREDLATEIRALYAPAPHFDDTLVTLDDRDAIARYMQSMAGLLDHGSVVIEQVVRDDPDVFVRWRMSFAFRTLGRRVESESIGLTHLRFDAEGRVVLHQDFWDSAGGLFEHLPLAGFFVRTAHDAIH
ncbi:MAG: nuclear transport factor 2 family protein [Wenzhouxiangellaceae bacterium]|nr:nuclear transport factor 2 family protein [Wenzhouxiangellaceae bacterium]